MRLVSYRSDRGDRAGVLRDGLVVDAGDALGLEVATVRGLLTDGLTERLAGADGDGVPLGEVELLPELALPLIRQRGGERRADHDAERDGDRPQTHRVTYSSNSAS